MHITVVDERLGLIIVANAGDDGVGGPPPELCQQRRVAAGPVGVAPIGRVGGYSK